jgi:hypothetical protein
MALHEREFFHERPETKPATFTCPKRGHRNEYQVSWILRTRKDRLPRCQRKFEIPSQQSIVLV